MTHLEDDDEAGSTPPERWAAPFVAYRDLCPGCMVARDRWIRATPAPKASPPTPCTDCIVREKARRFHEYATQRPHP